MSNVQVMDELLDMSRRMAERLERLKRNHDRVTARLGKATAAAADALDAVGDIIKVH